VFYWNRKTTRGMTKSRTLNLECLEARLCLSTYTTVDLLPLSGHDYSKALGLNDTGLAVGESRSTGDETTAVVWSVRQYSTGIFHRAGTSGLHRRPAHRWTRSLAAVSASRSQKGWSPYRLAPAAYDCATIVRDRKGG
jgi:hypothetical protein